MIASRQIGHLFIASIILAIIMSACSHSSRHTSADKPLLLEDSLPEIKRQSLDSFKREFFTNIYTCLSESGFTHNCDDNDAGGVSVAFVTDIDNAGHVAHCEIVGEDICGADRLKAHNINKCMLQYMQRSVFPPALRDTKLKFKLSRYVRS